MTALPARGWPRWAWLFGVFWIGPTVLVDEVHQDVRWFEPTWVALADEPSVVRFWYHSRGWRLGKASVSVVADDEVVYTPTWIAWRKGRAVVVGKVPLEERWNV